LASALGDRRAVLSDLREALNRERHNLARYPELLWQQVHNRARAEARSAGTIALLDRGAATAARATTPWLRQVWAPRDSAALVLREHADWVLSVATSASGTLVLTGGRDGLLCLWDGATGRLVAGLDARGAWVYDCVLWGQGRKALSCGGDRLACTWDLDTRRMEQAFDHPDEVRGCAVHEGRGLFATACYDGGVRVGSLSESRLVCGVRAHGDRANTVAFTPDGGHVVSGGRDGLLCVTDTSTGTVVRRAQAGSSCFRVAMLPQGDRFAVAHGSGDVSLWTVDALEEVARVRGAHGGEAVGCAASPDGARVATGGTDGSVAIWSIDGLAPIARFGGHGNAVLACAFLSPSRVATGSADNTARIFDVDRRAGEPLADLEAPVLSGPVWSAVAEPEGTVVAIDAGGTLARLDPRTGTVIGRGSVDAGRGPFHVSPPSSAGSHLAVGCPNGDVCLVERASLEAAGAWPCHAGWVASCSWSPDGRELLTSSVDGSVNISRRVFGGNLFTRARISLAPDQVLGASWLPDGKVLIGTTDSLQVWDPASGARSALQAGGGAVVATVVLGSGHAAGVFVDGRVAMFDATVPDADVTTGRVRHATFRAHDLNQAVWSACPFGARTIAIGATDGVTIWDVVTRQTVAHLPISGAMYSVCSVKSPEGRLVCAGDTAGRVWVYDLRGTSGGGDSD
jgi:WD40 repeat protein